MKNLQESDWISGPEFIRAREILIPGNKKVSDMKTTKLYRQERIQSKCLPIQQNHPQPGSGKGKGGKEYGVTFGFNKQTEPERKGATIKEVKTARVLYNFGANGDAGGTLSFSAGEDVEILNDSEEYWWQGVNDQGEEGWFPRCIVTLNSDTHADCEGRDASHPSNGDLQPKA